MNGRQAPPAAENSTRSSKSKSRHWQDLQEPKLPALEEMAPRKASPHHDQLPALMEDAFSKLKGTQWHMGGQTGP